MNIVWYKGIIHAEKSSALSQHHCRKKTLLKCSFTRCNRQQALEITKLKIFFLHFLEFTQYPLTFLGLPGLRLAPFLFLYFFGLMSGQTLRGTLIPWKENIFLKNIKKAFSSSINIVKYCRSTTKKARLKWQHESAQKQQPIKKRAVRTKDYYTAYIFPLITYFPKCCHLPGFPLSSSALERAPLPLHLPPLLPSLEALASGRHCPPPPPPPRCTPGEKNKCFKTFLCTKNSAIFQR